MPADEQPELGSLTEMQTADSKATALTLMGPQRIREWLTEHGIAWGQFQEVFQPYIDRARMHDWDFGLAAYAFVLGYLFRDARSDVDAARLIDKLGEWRRRFESAKTPEHKLATIETMFEEVRRATTQG